MVNTRKFIMPSNKVGFIITSLRVHGLILLPQVYEMRIRARVYHTDHQPRQVLVPTRCSVPARFAGPRYPYAEGMLADAPIQPYVHNCLVTVTEAGHTYRFRVFYKTHTKLRENGFLMGLHGSMFIMRAAVLEDHFVVNMRERDVILSDFLAKE